MVPKAIQPAEILKLPDMVVSRSDCAHLGRELELLDGKLTQAKIRKDAQAEAPRLSHLLEELSQINNLNLAELANRQRLQKFLTDLKTEAPVVHMSFAVEPSVQVTTKLITWLRSQIHPFVLLNIGLQPTIAAGCVVRVGSKYIDLSMRQHLLNKRADLIARLSVDVA